VTDVPAHTGARLDELIFLEPIFLAKVWGGSRLRDLFGFDLPNDRVGECLAVSARPEGDCRVRGGTFAGETLSTLWSGHPELFGGVTGDAFPLQVKLLDAREDLSVQVHPDAAHDAARGGAGKNEAWYVLRAPVSGQVVGGHTAQTREQFASMASEGRWGELLRRVDVGVGDYLLVPAGTVHAILAGSLFYEIQQASDVTYRLYDYDRLDGGVTRQLHVAEALEVVAVPSAPAVTLPDVAVHASATRSVYPRTAQFSFCRWEVRGPCSIPAGGPFLLGGVIEGSGTVNGEAVRPGDHFVVPCGVAALGVAGNLTLLLTGP
jgi:mannose-6-phosphate isomerase